MTITIPVPTEVKVAAIRLTLPVNYEEEDIPNDFPLRKDDVWQGTIDIDTGKIREWPAGHSDRLFLCVKDSGSYFLLDADGKVVASREEQYVPNCIPGSDGDYVEFNVDENGVIEEWPGDCDATTVRRAFYPDSED